MYPCVVLSYIASTSVLFIFIQFVYTYAFFLIEKYEVV
jgi:hypothetical protein